MSIIIPPAGTSLVDITIGVDPGLGGGVATLMGTTALVKSTPIITTKVRKRTKLKGMHDMTQRSLDMQGMYDALKIYQGQNVLFAIEQVGVMTSDAKASAFSFGEGFGYWKMAAVACGFKLIEIRPQEWKKFYPEMLGGDEIMDLRESSKALANQAKLLKDNKQKKRIKNEMATINRQIKAKAKDAARMTATNLYPYLADEFKLKKDDGKAEALLIARYAQATYRQDMA